MEKYRIIKHFKIYIKMLKKTIKTFILKYFFFFWVTFYYLY